ncbi:MAG: rRNA pseudouridine synthase [Clostridia bacterium]|nr:rRNA pseudouridine synthase [Clostridia bacterium]
MNSRRAAEAAIEAGEVTVNGRVATLGDKIDPDHDVVIYQGNPVRPRRKEYTYLMLNKPRGYLTSMTDPRGRKCVTDLLKGVHVRVYPVGRLDLISEGLLLLTDDGDLANKLTHPRHSVPKSYRVKVAGEVSLEQLAILRSPLELNGKPIQPVDVTLHHTDETGTVLRMDLYEGRNRQIRRMCEAAGLTVKRLNRVSIGELKLNGLSVGRWRYLTDEEVDYLKKITSGTEKKKAQTRR